MTIALRTSRFKSRRTRSTSALTEERVYARFPRQHGSVLVVGGGSVGSGILRHLAETGVNPLGVVDKDFLEAENLVRHEVGAEYLGWAKAEALADHLSRKVPTTKIRGHLADFLSLSDKAIDQLFVGYDVVVASTDSEECQRRINRACYEREKPAVFPSVHVQVGLREAEVAEVLWVLPGRSTPCYECVYGWRPLGDRATEARGGMGLDMLPLVHASGRIVLELLDVIHGRQGDDTSLDTTANLIYVHGLVPPTEVGAARYFDRANPLGSIAVEPELAADCSVCELPQLRREDERRRAEEQQRARQEWQSASGQRPPMPARRTWNDPQWRSRFAWLVALVVVLAVAGKIVAQSVADARAHQREEKAQRAQQLLLSQQTAAATLWTVPLPNEWGPEDEIRVARDLIFVPHGTRYQAYNMKGAKVWQYRSRRDCPYFGGDGDVVMGGTANVVVLGTGDCPLAGLSAASGEPVWALREWGDHPVIDEGRLFQSENFDSALASYDAGSGHLLWRSSFGESAGGRDISSILPDDGRVFAVAGQTLAAFDGATGRKLWALDHAADQLDLVGLDGGHLFLLADMDYGIHSRPEVIAVEKATGRITWQFLAPRSFKSNGAYLVVPGSGPLLLLNDDVKFIALSRNNGARGASGNLRDDIWNCSTCDLSAEPTSTGAVIQRDYLLDSSTGGLRQTECEGDRVFGDEYGLCLGEAKVDVISMTTGLVVGELTVPNGESALITNRSLGLIVYEDDAGKTMLTAVSLSGFHP